MIFAPLKLQTVKAISQRNLASYWLGLAARGGLPPFEDFRPSERMHDPKRILVWSVGGADAEQAFTPIYGGQYYIEAFGIEFDPKTDAGEQLRAVIFGGLRQCAATRSLIYMIITSADDDGQQIDCERLLIPFGNSDGVVTHIMAVVEVISLTGSFQRTSVFNQFNTYADVTLCGTIQGSSLV